MPPVLVWLLIVVALAAVFLLDRATGSAPAQHLYYLPIVLAAVRFGWPGGLTAALIAVALYHVANPLLLMFRYQELDLVQVTLFIAVGIVTARLVDDARKLRALASTDDLTGLRNLRAFEAALKTLVRHARARQSDVSLLVLDLDRLKVINDEFGHLAGAEAVRLVGRTIASRLGANAVACRYGGDEFAIVFAETPPSGVTAFATGLCHAIQTTAPVLGGVPLAAGTLSVSVGIVHRRFAGDDADRIEDVEEVGESLFRVADAALYAAKRNGRNRVFVA